MDMFLIILLILVVVFLKKAQNAFKKILQKAVSLDRDNHDYGYVHSLKILNLKTDYQRTKFTYKKLFNIYCYKSSWYR